MMHMSRLSEELILWSASEFKWVTLSDRHATGSSIMPQKKNPDIPELLRGKTGRVNGNLVALLTVMKGLPLAYNKDMQEDKEGVFDSVRTALLSLQVLEEMIADMTVNKKQMEDACMIGHLSATDLADYLVLHNVPFREAHGIVGRAVANCIEKGCELTDLSLVEIKEFSDVIDKDIFEVLSVEGSVDSRISTGGTATQRVEEAVAAAAKLMGIGE